MNDETLFWEEYKRQRKEKRAANRGVSRFRLTQERITFEERNGGAHLIVDGNIDFWPGTGLWIVRPGTKRERGVSKLIEHVKKQRLKAKGADDGRVG